MFKMIDMKINQISKFIALILRHKPESIGIKLDEHGWAKVDELIAGINNNQPFSFEDLKMIVDTDVKQRYSFNEDKSLIRANQGHSINVDVELQTKMPPNILWHGTGEKYVSSIDKEGLKAKSRLYVHLSLDKDMAFQVGSRHGKAVIYSIDARQMYKDGYIFYLSKNNVWLVKTVPLKYLKKLA